ncbi:MAG TPA: hypothetical protein PLG60_03925 [Acidimicrobiales bacterium]|nr:hypothetical protein [Acidimicrobiales bacterium]
MTTGDDAESGPSILLYGVKLEILQAVGDEPVHSSWSSPVKPATPQWVDDFHRP